MDIDETLEDRDGYLARMSASLKEKLHIATFLPADARRILDVGCADGTVTEALARRFPDADIKGIDLSRDFIGRASTRTASIGNLSFECVYLRELLMRKERYDVICFTSVLHEFYTYGEGISSVLKALADAHELLAPGGVILIRDMILPEYTKRSTFGAHAIARKIRARRDLAPLARDFEAIFGTIDTLYRANHFLLKYFYMDNWARECPEHYVPVTIEQYESIFALLGMELEHRELYTIPYLKDKWRNDLSLTDRELEELHSTCIFIARKRTSA
jgi:2-polyprenyl-3-methyl-5-hydroxy-6-metoxy-1,4-benzoquinol methylase